MADFLVVDQPSAYNAIIGRLLMKKTNMVSAVYCLTVKFSTPTRVGYIKVDQATAQQCHIQVIHLSKQAVSEPEKAVIGDILAIERDGSRINIEDLDLREDYPKPEPVEQTEKINISGDGRATRIGSLLNQEQRREMTLFLRQSSDVFALSTAEMPGIPPSVISNSLSINPLVRPVKRKKKKARS